MRIDEVELRVVRLPYRSPFKTSFGEEAEKHALIVTVRSEGVEGYGEGVMDPFPMYREETLPAAQHLLRNAFAPDLLANGCDHPSELVAGRWARWRGNPMAKTALELAVWDCFARQRGVPLRSLLGGERITIPVGASLGMTATIEQTVDNVTRHVEQGYQRVKLKIEPGFDVEPVRAVRERHPDVMLQVDANTAYTLADADPLVALDPFGLVLVEQPLAEDDLRGHAELARRLRTPICLDESITSVATTETALALGACSVVNVKAGRVGGYLEAVRVHDVCATHAVPVWCGGMLETGIGRAANVALAALPGFTLPGDTSASDRYYARDVVVDPFVLDDGRLAVPTGPGLGVTVDTDFVASITTSVETLRA